MSGRPRFTVGLTGGIGSGKSVVARLFAERGVDIVDTDQIARNLTVAGGAAMPAVLAAFGPRFADAAGALDRSRMRALVFSDPAAKARLEAILHPMIRDAVYAASLLGTAPYVIFDIPLLVESGTWRDRLDRVLVVDCPEDVQLARVMARNGLPAEQVQAIMAAQVPRQVRLAAADDVIDNGGDLARLAPQVDRLHALYGEMAAAAARNN
ncbi:dephospho-CoA kinase [Pseudoduganella buxea]|uniref:Dephospho-CoA kinase n=1 Tax=Pseudoduganella buxea TaxID=1949069 RepID=A0A6I3SS41_9BURK|nr:dephospho-CoA kinase [Pseudoduganella buxea]MTV51515.1 dephospho-CoA kinase [Pseudoduganella buxea]GGB89599.1 dephospho-CoA kinase [Pseudoduganella buxea]